MCLDCLRSKHLKKRGGIVTSAQVEIYRIEGRTYVCAYVFSVHWTEKPHLVADAKELCGPPLQWPLH